MPEKPEEDSKSYVLSGLLLSLGLLGVLVLLIFVIPSSIKGSLVVGKASEEIARERLNNIIQQQLSADMMQESAELAPARPAAVKFNVTGDGGSEDLRFARTLISKGKVALAIPYYESYLRVEPNKIPARLELINAYIASKQTHSARKLCISTLKRQLKSAEIGSVWQLMGKCQTD